MNFIIEKLGAYFSAKVCDADQVFVPVGRDQLVVALQDRGQIPCRGLLMDQGLDQARFADHSIPYDRTADQEARHNHSDSGTCAVDTIRFSK